MLKSIIRTALRNIARNRAFSFLNLFGLSVGMSLCLLIILMLKEQYSFDDFHKDADQIFRINTKAIRKGGSTESYASSPLPLGSVFRNNYTFADEVVSLNRQLSGEILINDDAIPMTGFYISPSFFDVFNFELPEGTNIKKALNTPNSIILTKSLAMKLFGTQSPLNKTIEVEGKGAFIVTGIIERPTNTHLEFDALSSLETMTGIENRDGDMSHFEDWKNYYSSYNYIKLKKEATQKEVSNILQQIAKEQYASLELETRDKGYSFFLQPLNEITPGPLLSNNMGKGMPEILLLFLVALAVVVMIMAGLNYTQLTIAKSVTRAREIGVRKVVGARRWQVFFQFIGEAIVVSLIALAFSYVLLQLMKPAVLNLHIADEFAVFLKEDLMVFVLFLGFALLVGLLAGIFPAIYLSAFNPSQVLKSGSTTGTNAKLTLRKVLMVFQLTLSIIFVLAVFMINKQTNYLAQADYGINTAGIVNIPLADVNYQQFAGEVSNLSQVAQVGGISHRLGTWEDRSSDYKKALDEEAFEVRDYLVDNNYLANIDVDFIAGRNFSDGDITTYERFAIINQKAVKVFGFEEASSALGGVIYVDDTIMLEIIGVTENFHFRPLNYEIGPVVFRLSPQNVQIASLKFSSKNIEHDIAQVKNIWERFDPVHTFEWKLMEHEIDEAYEQSGLNDISKIVGYISFLAICIAFMGLLGMVMYNVQRRLKEIGIRKIFGARPMQIVMALNKSFLILFLIAILVGVPVGYKLGDLFIMNYAYKADFGLPIIALSVALIIAIGLLTMTSSTLNAALSNPVKWLRQE